MSKEEQRITPHMFEKLQTEVNGFLNKIFSFVEELGIDVSGLKIDHMGLRYSDPKKVDQLSQELNQVGTKLSEAVVNGRKIYNFKLDTPITFKDFSIPCIELPYPAENHDYPNNGW